VRIFSPPERKRLAADNHDHQQGPG
jgi:hypothetical protein